MNRRCRRVPRWMPALQTSPPLPARTAIALCMGLVALGTACTAPALQSPREAPSSSTPSSSTPSSTPAPAPAPAPAAAPASASTPPTTPAPPRRVRVVAVGDLLMHLMVVEPARQKDGSWDFSSIFADTKAWIESADVAIANLETNFAGDRYPLAGYPVFNTPDAFARSIRDAGFDAVTLANNHILDHREDGVRRTIEVLDAAGLAHTGAAMSAAARDEVLVLQPVPGVRLALLSYTYGTNNPRIPHDHTVNLIDPARMRADVERARAGAGADVVLVALHVGREYTPVADDAQRRAIDAAVDAGADVVLGGHPHVIHHAWFSDGRAGIASLGNFVSAQPGRATQESVLFVVDIEKDDAGARVVDAGVVPIYTHLPGATQRNATVVPVEASLAALADDPRAAALRMRLGGVLQDLQQRLAAPTVGRLPPLPPTPRVAAAPTVERIFVPPAVGTGLWLAGALAGVTLTVDGAPTPLPVAGRRVVALPPGEHVVSAHRDGFLDVHRVVTVPAGRTVELPLPTLAVDAAGLVARAATGTATLHVDGPAGAVVVVDGKPLGTAPCRLALAAGVRRLEVQARNASPDVRTVALSAGRTTTVTGRPVGRLGALTIVTAEPGVTVAVDGTPRGTTTPTLALAPLARGPHQLTLTQPGRAPVTEVVVVDGDDGPALTFAALPPLAAPTGPRDAAAAPSTPAVTLQFSPPLLAAFADVRRQRTPPADVGPLFATLREHTAALCASANVERRTPRDALLQFVRPEALAVPPFAEPGAFRTQLISGCWNFFQMNDRRPDVDFTLVRRLLPDARFDCFSVGLLQPYLMHGTMGCARLTMLDFDWSIHDVHHQLLQRFADGRLRGLDGARAALRELRLQWSAVVGVSPRAVPEAQGSLEALTMPASSEATLQGLVDFQQRFGALDRVDLQVSELQDADFAFAPGTTPVLFLSNALEPVYTSRAQFDTLLRRVRAGLPDGGRAVFIHHAAGTAGFGVYELAAGAGGTATVTTRCKDGYVVSLQKKGEGAKRYDTWFESVTTSKPHTLASCTQHPLLRAAAAAAP